MKRPFHIAGRNIGDDYPPVVIVELGINHGGSLETAIKLVDAARKSGAEIIKHQTHVVDDEMSPAAKNVIPGNADESIYDIMKRCSLGEEEEQQLKSYVEEHGMIYLSTPFSRAAADRLHKMGVEAYKIGSGECNNLPLIRHIAGFGRPMVVSTGMNDIASVTQCVEILRAARVPFALLHTTNLYPTPLHLVRLGAMQQLQAAFPDVEVGLSDHTISNHACFAAVALGANIVERHFTDRKDRIGPDIINSMDQLDLKELILGIEAIAQMRGGEKKTIPEEQVTMDFAFATVVAIRNIRKGEVLTTDNIWVKRPGVGEIKAVHFDQLPGRVCRRDIAADEHLCWEDLADE